VIDLHADTIRAAKGGKGRKARSGGIRKFDLIILSGKLAGDPDRGGTRQTSGLQRNHRDK